MITSTVTLFLGFGWNKEVRQSQIDDEFWTAYTQNAWEEVGDESGIDPCATLSVATTSTYYRVGWPLAYYQRQSDGLCVDGFSYFNATRFGLNVLAASAVLGLGMVGWRMVGIINKRSTSINSA